MCVFVIDVNWQISAAVRKTSPSAISLKRRSSRPLAANRNMTSAATVRMRARTSMRLPGSAPEVWAVAFGRFQLIKVGFRVPGRKRPMLRDDVGEGGANGVTHRLRAADVDVTVGGEQAPDERALLADPVLNVFAGAGRLARRRDVNVVEHSFGGELPDLVAVDIVDAARADAVEERRLRQRGARTLQRQ